MRHSLGRELLEHLLVCGSSLMIHTLFTPYGQSLLRGIRNSERLMEKCPHDFSPHSHDTVSSALTRLKTKGFARREGSRKKSIWCITAQGKRHFKAGETHALPPKDGKVRLVIFDIPEGERKNRDWLRSRLLVCDYIPFQKSVWIGTRPLPKELRGELRTRALTSYVHVVGLEQMLPRNRDNF